VYPVIFIDAVNVKIRDGNVANRPIYIALAVTVEGTRDILGLWAGEHGDGEGAKFWVRVLSEIKNRGVGDVCMVVCDGLKGLPTSIETVWPQAITQTCVVHLLRNSFRYASKKHWAALAKDLKPIYTAPSESAALDAFVAVTEAWGDRYPAIIKLWESAWPEFVPFLQFDAHIRAVVCTTNAIESINARIRRAVNARGHFPTVLWNQDCQVRADRPWLTATIGSEVAAVSCRGVVPAGVGMSARRCSRWSRAAWPSSTAVCSSSVSGMLTNMRWRFDFACRS